MAGLILFFVAFAAHHAIHHHHAHRALPVEVQPIASEPNCTPSPDSVWVADLKQPGSVRWLLGPDGTLCDPEGTEPGRAEIPPAEPTP